MTTYSMLAMAIVSFCLCSCNSPEQDFARVRAYKDFSCSSPGVEEFGGWGKNGRMRRCVIKDGSFVTSEGDIFLAGQYKLGKQVGTWRWYDKEGKLIKEVVYSKAPE